MGFFDNKREDKINEEMMNVACSGVKLIRLQSFEEVAKIAELIKNRNVVTFNLENVKNDDGQRVIDYLSGATYVLGGRIEKITDKVYISIPDGMEVENFENKE